jgi:hypothetical protein
MIGTRRHHRPTRPSPRARAKDMCAQRLARARETLITALDQISVRAHDPPVQQPGVQTAVITALAPPASRFNTHSHPPRPPQTPAASFKRLYRK